MPIENINVGALPNDGSGDAVRTAFGKVNNNFGEVETLITASDANSIPVGEKGAASGVATLDADARVVQAPPGMAGALPFPGRYTLPLVVPSNTNISFAAGFAYWLPYLARRGGTADRIGVRVVTASPGVTLALGIYDADPVSLMPTTLLVLAGTVDLSTTGTQEITISFPVAANRLLYLASLPLGGAATLYACTPLLSGASGLTDTALGRNTLFRTGLGALPDPAGTPAAGVTFAPVIALKVEP